MAGAGLAVPTSETAGREAVPGTPLTSVSSTVGAGCQPQQWGACGLTLMGACLVARGPESIPSSSLARRTKKFVFSCIWKHSWICFWTSCAFPSICISAFAVSWLKKHPCFMLCCAVG